MYGNSIFIQFLDKKRRVKYKRNRNQPYPETISKKKILRFSITLWFYSSLKRRQTTKNIFNTRNIIKYGIYEKITSSEKVSHFFFLWVANHVLLLGIRVIAAWISHKPYKLNEFLKITSTSIHGVQNDVSWRQCFSVIVGHAFPGDLNSSECLYFVFKFCLFIFSLVCLFSAFIYNHIVKSITFGLFTSKNYIFIVFNFDIKRKGVI